MQALEESHSFGQLREFAKLLSRKARVGSNPTSSATYKIKRFLRCWDVKLLRNLYVPPMYYVYILKSTKDDSLYIGYTSNLKKRFVEHNTGKSLATRHKRPYKLIFYEAFINKIDAKNRESYLKSGWGFRSIKKLLKRSL